MNFKVKVYLSPTKEERMIDGLPFLCYMTRWTFAICQDRALRERPLADSLQSATYYSYHKGQYVDGSSWRLSEIDGYVDLDEIEIEGHYEVFNREMKAFPIYATKPAKDQPKTEPVDVFGAAEVIALYPLALDWGGALICGREYRVAEGTGKLVSVTISRKSAIDSLWASPQERKEAAKLDEYRAIL